MRVSLRLLLLCGLMLLVGCVGPEDDWGDDHLVLDELELLEESDLWVEVFGLSTQRAPCSFALCQNVVGGASYEVIGDVDEAKVAALDALLQTWEPTGDDNPYAARSSDFRLREGVDIETTTGTAFLTVEFVEDLQVGQDTFVDDAIAITFTSDIDPDWMTDEVLNMRNILSRPALAILVGLLCMLATAFVVVRRTRPVSPPVG